MLKIAYLLFFLFFVLMNGYSFAQTFKKDTLPSKKILYFPVIAKSIETNWSFGLAGSATFRLSKSDTTSRTSNIQSVVLYSLKKQFITAINGAEYFKNEKYILNEQISYSSFPDKFWGIGNTTPDSIVEHYSFQQYYLYLHLLRNLGHHFFGGVLYEMQHVYKINYITGGLFDQENIAGRSGYFVSGLGLSLTYDDRNDAFAPDKGNFAQIYFNHFDPLIGSSFNYTNLVVDLRKFLRIYRKQVLALQGFSFSNIGAEVPLRSLASLGGANSMRGYYGGRYRDKQAFVLQAEYRVPIYKSVGIALFGSSGEVGHAIDDFALNGLKYAYGAGLRIRLTKKEKLNLRLDYGIGQGNNQGFYLQLGEAF
ncbi:MAG: outer membrane protein assembly factor [Hydrotalea flava]|uniref:BamA/TamA family outer membrane protein n=1 Tax=Hydrotalea TaxID=1004300 RepID=UPI001C4939ED|nr:MULTISPECIES: BamA/TamA family outer membrane protein [Hydrotalea]MBY0347650.1 outer membrane protein assembly factor [Hydrotalea flava]